MIRLTEGGLEGEGGREGGGEGVPGLVFGVDVKL